MFGEQTLRPVKNGLYVHRNRRLIRDRTAASTFTHLLSVILR